MTTTHAPAGLDACPRRFRDKVAVSDGCWIWTGYTLPRGYGRYSPPATSETSRIVLAHRYAYEQMVGPIPDGMEIDHLCRVKSCVRPDHLEAVTPAENRRRQGAAHTHCLRGHEYTPENTGLDRGQRRCLTCNREKKRARRLAAKAASA